MANSQTNLGTVDAAGSLSAGNVIQIERISKVYQTGDIQVHALRGL